MIHDIIPENSKIESYPGVVVNNNDPLKAQRLQCRVSVLHQGIGDSDLPWCRPIREKGSSTGAVTVGVPAIGSIVSLEFNENDNANIYWKGVFLFNNSLPEDFAASFPSCYGFVDANNNLFIVDTDNNSATFTLSNGTSISLNSSAMNVISNTVLNIRGTNDINLSAAGSVNIKGTTVNINAGSTSADSLTSPARGAITMPASSVSNMTEY